MPCRCGRCKPVAAHTRFRLKAAEVALFISLEDPTRGMIADAVSAGFYESATGKKFPRVQLLTIEGLLSGKQRAEHPDPQPDLNFKKREASLEGVLEPVSASFLFFLEQHCMELVLLGKLRRLHPNGMKIIQPSVDAPAATLGWMIAILSGLSSRQTHEMILLRVTP